MAKSNSPSESTKSIIAFILLLIVYPIGLIVMWTWTPWNKWVKWLVTAPIIFMIIGGIFVGLTQSLDLNTQIKKGECTKQCANSQLKETCMSQCMGSLNASPSGYRSQ